MPSPSHAPANISPHPLPNPPPSHELTVQEAVATDAEAIVSIGVATFTKSFGHSMPAEDMRTHLEKAYTPTAILTEMAKKENQFFVAMSNSARVGENGQVVGFIQMKLGSTEPCLDPDVPMCGINRIYVSSDHHGQGVGQLMVERGLDWARERLLGEKQLVDAVDGGVKEGKKAGVWLGVWEENVKAQRFYRRWGFETVGAHDFVMGETTQTDLVMVKWL